VLIFGVEFPWHLCSPWPGARCCGDWRGSSACPEGCSGLWAQRAGRGPSPLGSALFRLFMLPGFYLYLTWPSLLFGPVSESLEVFPVMLAGSSPEQMSFSLGSGAAAPNLGQAPGLPEQPRPCVGHRRGPAPRRYRPGADTGRAGGRSQRRSGLPRVGELVALKYSGVKRPVRSEVP